MNAFQIISTFFIIIPIITGLIRYKKLDGLIKKVLFFLFFELATEIVAEYMALKDKNNTLLYGGYILFEYSFFAYFFYQIIISPRIRRMLILSIPVFSLTTLYEIIKSYHSTVQYTWGFIIELSFFVIWSIIYYYRLITAEIYIKLGNDADFWLVSGILLYSVGVFFAHAFYSYLHIHYLSAITHIDTIFISISNLLLYSLFTIAFLCPMKVRE